MYIVADVGGTKTVLAKASADAGNVSLTSVRRFINTDYSSFEAVFGAYCNAEPADRIRGLGVAAAGRVTDNRCRMTNLQWLIDSEELSRRFDIDVVTLHNDLAASGYGLDVVSGESFEVIRSGKKKADANRILISPGTGLGECIIHALHDRHVPIPSEGGHADFAPFDGTTARLWSFVRRNRSRVSVENILSGPGINDIYRFVVSENGGEVDPETEKKMAARPGAIIADRARNEGEPNCIRAIRLFFDVLAAECGNMALKALSTGGVYIGGGIVPYALPLMDRSRFANLFADRKPHGDMLANIPLYAVVDTDLPLYGVAHHLCTVAGT